MIARPQPVDLQVDLYKKYNVQGPRYTSYPTVPYWRDNPTAAQWLEHLQRELQRSQLAGRGAAIYIHIPFCEQLCTFCACNRYITKNHQKGVDYIDDVLKEWQLYVNALNMQQLDVAEVHLGGGTPTFLNPEELQLLLKPIFAQFNFMPDAELSFEADPRVTTVEHLQTLFDLGFRRISFGVQDYDPIIQTAINREQSPDMVSALTRNARRIGFNSINYDLVYGLPFQQVDGIRRTLELVAADKPDRIAFYAYAHVPWVGKTGQRKFSEVDLPSGATKRQLYETGRAILESSGYREVGMDHFALPNDKLFSASKSGQLFRNFMGYIPQHVSPMISLGCSAISDAWTCFMQNDKDLQQYQSRVRAGELPIMRGHILSSEDVVLRQHILNLMTRFETSWHNAAQFTDYLMTIQPLLQEPLRDGLIELDEMQLRITAKGQPFVRNICMAFDARLQRQAPETQIFSKTI